ncbi:hypothetical protein Pan216_12680 [Planctomycetes bacterium Pan216]|uniref:Uncharacterized protein n=1 Tax=Kolteria novifilia TaxID=2527975 RepID=A0A518B0B7_9BACT|nr:hypothetical protein Pan216_12680 [Planctomycetes bacterium Pan216]
MSATDTIAGPTVTLRGPGVNRIPAPIVAIRFRDGRPPNHTLSALRVAYLDHDWPIVQQILEEYDSELCFFEAVEA